MIRSASCSLAQTVEHSPLAIQGMLVRAPKFVRWKARFRPYFVFSIGNGDAQSDTKDQASTSVRSRLEGRALSIIRNRFMEAVSAIAASRINNDVQEFQGFELPLQTLETPLARAGMEAEEIAAVTEDDLDPSIQWEQRRKDVDAEKARPALSSPGFSFSAAGLLFPYHLGVGQCLIERGCITENTPLSGSSAGALVCAVVATGFSMHEAMLATKELAKDCRANGTAFRLGAVLRAFLERFLPDDAHIKSNGRIRVAITQVFRSPRGLLVDQFSSKADLIDALLTSCFIPGYFAPRPITLYKNRMCMDGGLTLFMPPTSADLTVRVCAFPAAQLGLKGIGISPDCNPTPDRASARQLLSWALEPAADEILENLFNLGYQDALVWATQHKLNELSQDRTICDAELPRTSHI